MAFYKTSLFDEIWSKSLTKTNTLEKLPLSIPSPLGHRYDLVASTATNLKAS